MISQPKLFFCFTIVFYKTTNTFGDIILLDQTKSYESDRIKSSESRQRYTEIYPHSSKSEYKRKESDLVVTFQAPQLEAQDYWQFTQNEQNDHRIRKLFLDYYNNRPNEKKRPLPGINDNFYQFMSALLGEKGQVVTASNGPFHNFYRNIAIQEHFPGSLNFRSSFIPPHKPIRASVVKLETITRSPAIYFSQAYPITQNYYANVESLLNHVLIEKTKNHNKYDLDFPYSRNMSMLVLPKPILDTTTTEKLNTRLFNSTQNKITYTPNYLKRYDDAYIYPTPAFDKLRTQKESVPPFVSIKTIPCITPILPPDTLSLNASHFKYNQNIIFSNIENENVVKTVNHSGSISRKNERYNAMDNIKNSESIAFTNFNVPNLKSNNHFETSELKRLLEKTSIERLGNLTAEGLLNNQKDNPNVKNYINANTRNIINYGRQLENVSKNSEYRFYKDLTRNKSFIYLKKNVNLNDELSLDAKILKDTNWDGFTTTQSILTTTLLHQTENYFHSTNEMPAEEAKTTNSQMQKFNIQPTVKLQVRKLKDFLEINQQEIVGNVSAKKSMAAQELNTNIEPIPLTTEQTNKIKRIPLLSNFKNFNATETTPVFTSTEATTMEVTLESLTKTALDGKKLMPTREINTLPLRNSKMMNGTESYTLFPSKSKYRRRLKTANFSRNSSISKGKKKVFNRNHFLKRQKPNITLSIGSKNLLRNRDIYGKHEVMRFSDEDINRGRMKLEKRRQVYKKIINLNSKKTNGD